MSRADTKDAEHLGVGSDYMIEWIDETSEKLGTPASRKNLMAMQGYQQESVDFGDKIVKTNGNGEVETIKFEGNKIIKEFVGEKTIRQTITFLENGYTKELS